LENRRAAKLLCLREWRNSAEWYGTLLPQGNSDKDRVLAVTSWTRNVAGSRMAIVPESSPHEMNCLLLRELRERSRFSFKGGKQAPARLSDAPVQ
jgi:hypothetical protein